MTEHDVRRLWLTLKDAIANLKDVPTVEQVRRLAWAFSLLELGYRGTINVDAVIKDLIDAGLNPLPNLEGIAKLYEEEA